MTVEVKICGIRDRRTLDAALDAGADYFGLVFYPRSPRHVGHEDARSLIRHAAGRAHSVVLLVDPSDEDVLTVARDVQPDYLQLHGSETPERVREIARLSGLKVIKAVRVASETDVAAADAFTDGCAFLLFDAKPPADDATALPGGNGVPFDWRALTGIADETAYMLSGGLDPDNVSEAVDRTGAPMVDVSSGVERAPGDKDPDLIRDFIQAAKSDRPAAPAE